MERSRGKGLGVSGHPTRGTMLAASVVLLLTLAALVTLAALFSACTAGGPSSAMYQLAQSQAGAPQAEATPTREAKWVFGPASGGIVHTAKDVIDNKSVDVSLRDFVADVRFYNPYDRAGHAWDYGILFRWTDKGCAWVFVDSNGNWGARSWLADGANTPNKALADGLVASMDFSPSGSNLLRLVAEGQMAWFYINGQYVGGFEIPESLDPGKVATGIGYRTANKLEGKETRYDGLTLWDWSAGGAGSAGTGTSSSAATAAQQAADAAMARATRLTVTASGVLTHTTTNSMIVSLVAKELTDLAVEATFANPYGPSTGGWDYGLFFRNSGPGDQYRLTVDSDSQWRLYRARKVAGKVVFEDSGKGAIEGLNLTASGSNKIRLVALADKGYLFVNDKYAATLDLSQKMDYGSLFVVTNSLVDHAVPGQKTVYSNLSAWNLE